MQNDANSNVSKECDGPEQCLRRACTQPSPTRATQSMLDHVTQHEDDMTHQMAHLCKSELHSTSNDAPPPSVAVTQQEEDVPLPALCRFETTEDESKYEWQPHCRQPHCTSTEASPPWAAVPRQEEDEWVPVSSELQTVAAFTHAAMAPAVAAVLPAAPTTAPAGTSNIAPSSSAISTAAAQPQTLTGTFCVNTGCFRTLWWVDARKLRGNDKQAVSPPFKISSGGSFPSVRFKLMIHPKVMSGQKGGASFKKANGRGLVQIKCEAELSDAIANFRFRISIGTGENQQVPRGPKVHNFLASALCGLDKDEEEWDFQSAVDPESMTFVVCLEILPLADARLGQT